MVKFNSDFVDQSHFSLRIAVMTEEIGIQLQHVHFKTADKQCPLEGANREKLEKPTFFFGNSILVLEESPFEDKCKFVRWEM